MTIECAPLDRLDERCRGQCCNNRDAGYGRRCFAGACGGPLAVSVAHAEPTAAVAHTGTAVSGQEDVSQINGQLVEVGDHNRYRHTYRKINVSANPVGMIVGVYGVSASYAMHPNFALREEFSDDEEIFFNGYIRFGDAF